MHHTHHAAAAAAVTSVVSDSVQPHRQQPTRLPRPWDSPGKNAGVGASSFSNTHHMLSINTPTPSVKIKLPIPYTTDIPNSSAINTHVPSVTDTLIPLFP